jgi:hypothetical protein
LRVDLRQQGGKGFHKGFPLLLGEPIERFCVYLSVTEEKEWRRQQTVQPEPIEAAYVEEE